MTSNLTRIDALKSSRRELFNETTLVKFEVIYREIERLNVDVFFAELCHLVSLYPGLTQLTQAVLQNNTVTAVS